MLEVTKKRPSRLLACAGVGQVVGGKEGPHSMQLLLQAKARRMWACLCGAWMDPPSLSAVPEVATGNTCIHG